MNQYIDDFTETVEPMKEYLYENYVKKSKRVYKSYCEHLHSSLSIAGHFGIGAIKMFINAFIPDYYEKSTSECLKKVITHIENNSSK